MGKRKQRMRKRVEKDKDRVVVYYQYIPIIIGFSSPQRRPTRMTLSQDRVDNRGIFQGKSQKAPKKRGIHVYAA
jgi:hypothetical protein